MFGGDRPVRETFGVTTGSRRKNFMGKEKCKLASAPVAESGEEGDI
jgi:hypothetical protein